MSYELNLFEKINTIIKELENLEHHYETEISSKKIPENLEKLNKIKQYKTYAKDLEEIFLLGLSDLTTINDIAKEIS